MPSCFPSLLIPVPSSYFPLTFHFTFRWTPVLQKHRIHCGNWLLSTDRYCWSPLSSWWYLLLSPQLVGGVSCLLPYSPSFETLLTNLYFPKHSSLLWIPSGFHIDKCHGILFSGSNSYTWQRGNIKLSRIGKPIYIPYFCHLLLIHPPPPSLYSEYSPSKYIKVELIPKNMRSNHRLIVLFVSSVILLIRTSPRSESSWVWYKGTSLYHQSMILSPRIF